MSRRGLALILVVGVLGVLAVLGSAFVVLSRMERKAAQLRVLGTQALLLARSGVEDATARLALGQDPSYFGEDWNADGVLNAGPETEGQVYRTADLDVALCPVRHAMRPSFFRAGATGPRLVTVEGKPRGLSGFLRDGRMHWTLRVRSQNDRIDINGGALDVADRDPDGPEATAADFPLNPNAVVEVSPLEPNGVQDYHDVSNEGPNGFLVRLLNNLEQVVTGAAGTLGTEIVGARPPGGYRSVAQLEAVLTPARYEQFRLFLCVGAWADPTTLKPQPADGRPHRFQDIDERHRIGSDSPTEISRLTPISGVSGAGTPSSPWTQMLRDWNRIQGTTDYPVSWERNYLYAWRQLRLAPPVFEPRAPISLNTASAEVLAAVFLKLKGTYLEVWDGPWGWESFYGFLNTERDSQGPNVNDLTDPPGLDHVDNHVIPYPDPLRPSYPQSVWTYGEETEPTPWTRTRADNGMGYAPTGARPQYAPRNYDPAATDPHGSAGKPMVQCIPLGRLKATAPIGMAKAKAVAREVRAWIRAAGPFRTWADFNAFVDALPLWEDLDGDGAVDGAPYTVPGVAPWSITYTDTWGVTTVYPQPGYPARTSNVYRREDVNGNGVMDNQAFPDGTPGLTFQQKALLKAMANPNADLNDFNPDANLFKEIDKTDVCGLLKPNPPAASGSEWAPNAASAYAHTTELSLEVPDAWRISCASRVLGPNGAVLAQRQMTATGGFTPVRDTTQADFMRDFIAQPATAATDLFLGGWAGAAPYPLASKQPLASYPEPQAIGASRAAGARYDGQIGLGFIGQVKMPGTGAITGTLDPERLRACLFGTPDPVAGDVGPPSTPDLRGPFQRTLLTPAGTDPGGAFPDGAYSEKDACLRYPTGGTIGDPRPVDPSDPEDSGGCALDYVLCAWVKVNWFPEASPGPHALLSAGGTCTSEQASREDMFGVPDVTPNHMGFHQTPVDDLPGLSEAMFFLPGRNNGAPEWNSAGAGPTWRGIPGHVWPRRSLHLGGIHDHYYAPRVQEKGADAAAFAAKPIGRLEARRWMHVAFLKDCNILGVDASGENQALYRQSVLGRMQGVYADWRLPGSMYGVGASMSYRVHSWHVDGTENHIRFGEVSGAPVLNFPADATFADVRAVMCPNKCWEFSNTRSDTRQAWLKGLTGPACLGRYFKEASASYRSSSSILPQGAKPVRVTWTEIPCDLWFDEKDNVTAAATPDGWMDAASRNDRFGPGGVGGPDGKRDVRIDLEVWDDRGTPGYSAAETLDDVRLARFDDPARANLIPAPRGRIYYKAVFVNDWDASTRLNHPLDVTPFLDDVTILYCGASGPTWRRWTESEADEE